MVKLLGHRQTKETATDKLHLLLPRHIPTLPWAAVHDVRSKRPLGKSGSRWEWRLTSEVANSHYRPSVVVGRRWIDDRFRRGAAIRPRGSAAVTGPTPAVRGRRGIVR